MGDQVLGDPRTAIQATVPMGFASPILGDGLPMLVKIVQPEWGGAQAPNFDPAPPASNWKDLTSQINATARARYQDARRHEAEKLELQKQIEMLKEEKEREVSRHRVEMEHLEREMDKRNLDGLSKLRRENGALEEEFRNAQTSAQEEETRRLEAEGNLDALLRKISRLEVQCARREAEAEKEIERVKGERDASYRRTQERAEERVKAMCSLAKEAQEKMYKNMDALEKERRVLAVRVEHLPRLSRGELILPLAGAQHFRAPD